MANKINQGCLEPRRLSLSEKFLSFFFRAIPVKHGKHRILDRSFPKSWDKTGRPVVVSIHGFDVTVDIEDLVGWHFAMLKSFDPEVVQVLEKACSSAIKEVFWDVGANKGACFCNLAAKLPLLQVVAIEPQRSLVVKNIQNLNSVCPGRYEYVCAGIGAEQGEATLVIPQSNSGKASLHAQQYDASDTLETIEIKTASKIANNSRFGWPTVAKIDVEGYELQVLRSLEPCLRDGICKVIVFESHFSNSEDFGIIESLIHFHKYSMYGIKKYPWSIRLVSTKEQLRGVSDYAIVRNDWLKENKRFANLLQR